MFGISLAQHATESLLVSGVDMFLSYYKPTTRASDGGTGHRLPRDGQGTRGGIITYATDSRVDAYIDALPRWG